MLSKISKLLNIKVQENQSWLLLSSALSGLIYTYTAVPISKEFWSSLPSQYFAVEALWFNISALAISFIWKSKTREIALKYFAVIALTESLCAFLLSLWLVFVHYNVWIFAIASMLYISIVTAFVAKCVMTFKTKLWNGRSREMLDNTDSIFRNGIAIVGFALAAAFMPNLKTAILIWGLGCIIDDIGWIIVYLKCRKCIVAEFSNTVTKLV